MAAVCPDHACCCSGTWGRGAAPPYYWRVFETSDEYFDYHRDYHAFWKLYGVNLPDAVLRKLYYANALKVTPGLPKRGFTKRSPQ